MGQGERVVIGRAGLAGSALCSRPPASRAMVWHVVDASAEFGWHSCSLTSERERTLIVVLVALTRSDFR